MGRPAAIVPRKTMKNLPRETLPRMTFLLGRTVVFLTVAFLCFLPVPVVSVLRENGTLWMQHKALPGQEVVTIYTHSVERTEVRDLYLVTGGALWAWETWTKSQNAGLPTETGLWGRYLFRSPWQVYQGSRTSFRRIVWRVGNGFFGKNVLIIPPDVEEKVFLSLPDQRLIFAVSWSSCFF